MAQVDATSFNAALKTYYTDEAVQNTVYKKNPLFAMLSKNTSWTGRTYDIPIQTGISSGSRSGDVSVSLGNKDTNKYQVFSLTSNDDFNAISITRKIMKQSGNNRGAFFTAKTREIDGMLQALSNSISHALFRNGGGAIGQVSSTSAPSTTTFTLNEIEDVVHFERGMRLQASAADGSTSTDTLLDAGATGVISAVNRDTGVITSSSNWTAQIPSLTTSSFLFPEGDFGGTGGNATSGKVRGLGAWCPRSAPGSTTFFGVNRSVDPTRLAGVRVDGAAMTILEALRAGASRVGREQGEIDTYFMSWQKYNDLVTELDNKVQYTQTGISVDVGFDAIRIVGMGRPIKIYADRNCPDNIYFGLMMESFELISYGNVPEMVDEDGLTMLREKDSSGFEVRAEYMAQLACYDTRNIVNCLAE